MSTLGDSIEVYLVLSSQTNTAQARLASYTTPPSFLERVEAWAAFSPDNVLYRWLDHHGRSVETMTHKQLWDRS